MSDDKPVYAQINRKVWNTSQFRALSQDARELFFYLTTCPHGNMLGIFVLRPGYALDDLQWGTDRKRFAKGLAELLEQGLFEYDSKNEIILDREQIEKHPPENPNQVRAAIKLINSLPKTPLFQSLKLLVEQLGKQFLEPLAKQLGERFGKPVTETVTETETVTVTEERIGGKPPKRTHKIFSIPSVQEISEYCKQRKNNINPQYFFDYQQARDWVLSNGKRMVDWQATIRTWELNNYGGNGNGSGVNGRKPTVVGQARGARSDEQPYPVDGEF